MSVYVVLKSDGVASVGGIDKLQVSFTKEPYKRDNILQKKPVIESILRTVATSYVQRLSARPCNNEWLFMLY